MNTIIINDKNESNFIGCTLTFGHFSTIHPGHIRYLSNAKEKGGKLVIALIGEEIQSEFLKYKYTQEERAYSLKILNIANAILLLKSDDLTNGINKLKPKNLFLGSEFRNSKKEEIINSIKLMKNNKGKVFFDSGNITYSSSYLLEDSEKSLKEKRISLFSRSLKKLKIKKLDLLNSLKKLHKGRVLVIGDTIIDQYINSEPLGISAEAPVIVVKEINKKNFIGGAAIVASHIKSLGSECNYISVIGIDKINNFLKKKLTLQNINFELIEDEDRPTTLKKRYIVDNQKIFRVSKLDDRLIQNDIEDEIIKLIKKSVNQIDAIVVSDFNYGVITPKIIQEITLIAKKFNIILIGDVQCSSQIGYVTKLQNFDLICANEKEARISLNDHTSGLEVLCKNLINKTNVKNLIVKLGAKGIILYKTDKNHDIISQPLPALSTRAIDTAGAGDSLLSIMACGLSSGLPIEIASALSCLVTSLAVEKMGNVPISKDLLENEIRNLDF